MSCLTTLPNRALSIKKFFKIFSKYCEIVLFFLIFVMNSIINLISKLYNKGKMAKYNFLYFVNI